MRSNHIKAAVIGGLVVFIWMMLSWMVLPGRHHCIKRFTNESEVARAIVNNAPVSGIYVLPNTCCYDQGTSDKEMEKGMRMMEKGPFMFSSVHPEGIGRMTALPFIRGLILEIIGAFIVVWMLLQTKGLSFRSQVLFVTVFGFAVGLLGELCSWNWWGFSLGYVVLNIVHLTIAWFLAGLCIVKFLKR